MTILIVGSALAGMLLGLRFNVLILLPAIALSSVVTIVTLVGPHNRLLTLVIGIFGTLTALQLGYALGCVIRTYPFATPKRSSRRDSWLPTLPTNS